MDIRKHARVLVAALAIGSAVLSLGTGQAEAKPRHPGDNGVRCVVYGGAPEDMTFYMPGDVITDNDGSKLVCGSDGEWHPVRTDDSGGRTHNGGGLGAHP